MTPALLPGWRVLCPDRRIRTGVWFDPARARLWAKHPGCCQMGRHRVVRVEALGVRS